MSVTVEVRNAGKIYPGGTEALKGINLSIKEGEVVGLIGPNGAGREVRIKVSQKISETLKATIAERYKARAITGEELIVSDEGADTRELVRYLVEQGVDVERVEENKLTLEDIYTTIIKEDEER